MQWVLEVVLYFRIKIRRGIEERKSGRDEKQQGPIVLRECNPTTRWTHGEHDAVMVNRIFGQAQRHMQLSGLCTSIVSRPSIHHTPRCSEFKCTLSGYLSKLNTSFPYSKKRPSHAIISIEWWRSHESYQFDNELISVFRLPLWIRRDFTKLMDLPNVCFECYLLQQYLIWVLRCNCQSEFKWFVCLNIRSFFSSDHVSCICKFSQCENKMTLGQYDRPKTLYSLKV